ncbi:MAG: Cna B-type domain-containing protein, partial [Lachnospiraceae bacterium]|nr:Cna B-type domain-containing protein [Lachnospiraceae bacterium]
QQQLAEVTFTTSPNGAASKLPAGYSIEVRDLLVGTAFKVLEEDYEIPVGYGRRIWEETSLDGTTTTYEGYKRVEGSYLVSEGDTQNSGVIRDNSNPKVEVHNQRGWGIRAEKSWSDSDFMRAHDDTFFAVYVGDELLDGTVRRIDAYNYTTYFFPALEEGARFADYQVCEVKPENPVVDEDGTVSSYDSITRLAAGEEIVLGGTDKDGQTLENLHYSVSYSQGTESPLPGDEGVVRTDRVTNTRTGGLRIVKTDWEGNALACAEFELKKGEEVKDTFTSDMNGVLTTAYPEDGEYTLTETKAPKAYQGLETAVEITVSEGNYSITSDAENGVIYDEETNTLTLKNKPFTLKAVKRDTEGTLLPGAHFALYTQVPVSGGGVRKDYYPISGYEDLESGADGVVDKINESLNPGTYYLSEITAPEGYGLPQEDLCFTIGNDGRVTINTEDDSTWLDTVKEDDRIEYTIGIINIKLTDVTARKEWYTERNKIQDDQANKNVPEGAWSELTLFAEGSDTAIRTIRLDGTIDDKGETAKWEATFADVPSTDSSGNTIRYLIKETAYSETIGSTHFYAVRKETVDGGAIRNAVMFGNI